MSVKKQTSQCTLYYDGNCPLCNREMSHLAKLSSDNLHLQDIHQIQNMPDSIKQQRLKVLTIVKENGEVVSGLDANVLAWSFTRFGFLLRWIRWPLIRSVADKVYSGWAERRYRRMYGEHQNEK